MHDFDFYIGHWDVANRRLTSALTGSDEWEEFPGVSRCRAFMGGGGNIDEVDFPTLGSSGVTFRLFDTAAKKWWLYWANSRTGLLQPPVTGGFTDGRGEFFGDDEHDGKPVLVRYIWSRVTTASPRWEQAYSPDGGQTWETNWIMDFSRAG